jgi:hypothetical protein
MAPEDGITCGGQSSTPLHGGEERVKKTQAKGGDWAREIIKEKQKSSSHFQQRSLFILQVCGATVVVAAIATRLPIHHVGTPAARVLRTGTANNPRHYRRR